MAQQVETSLVIIFGSSANPVYSQMIEEKRLGNPLLTWEKARKLNLGVDMNFLKNHLTVFV